MRYSKEFKEKFIEQLKIYMNNVSRTCEALKVPRQTFEFWKRHDKKFMEMLQESEARQVDYVESKLMSQIEKGNIKAIKYFLSTRGRKYGWGPENSQNISITNENDFSGKPMIIFSSTADGEKAQQGEEDVEGDES